MNSFNVESYYFRAGDETCSNYLDFKCRCGREHVVDLPDRYKFDISFRSGYNQRSYECNKCNRKFTLSGTYIHHADIRPNRNISCNPANEEYCCIIA